MIERLAIAHPETAFEFTHNDRRVISVPGKGELMDAIIHLYGLPLARQMIRVQGEGPAGTCGRVHLESLPYPEKPLPDVYLGEQEEYLLPAHLPGQ